MIIDYEFGNYRIIYTLDTNKILILITRADNRGQVYKS